ncbi:MAG: DUF4932 domain-containing protein [Sedimentisphaerales bacterium]|nr:DUF4932 domain-containing protein [Sedimentisphaerales bacterium]
MGKRYSHKIIAIILILSFIAAESSSNEESNQQKPTRSISVSVDPRVELMSIIFRLAGNPEYNRSQFFSYIGDIETHFKKFKEHPVIKLAKQLRNSRGVSYDAVICMAIHIKDVNEFEMLLPLEPWPETLDKRWEKDKAAEFIDKAKQFARESKFNEFFNAHKSMYDRAAEQFSSMMDKEAHLEWFDEFFGARPGAEFTICLGMINGPGSYGGRIKVDGKEKYYCIPGVNKFTLLGLGEPRFDKTIMPTVIHEFCHSYANPIVEAHQSEIENAGKRVYAAVEKQMERNAYGNWLTVMRESLVRACVVRYLVKNDGIDTSNKQIKSDISRGFLWMQELSDLLIEYEQQRNQYPALDAFFPKVIEFFDNYKKD